MERRRKVDFWYFKKDFFGIWIKDWCCASPDRLNVGNNFMENLALSLGLHEYDYDVV